MSSESSDKHEEGDERVVWLPVNWRCAAHSLEWQRSCYYRIKLWLCCGGKGAKMVTGRKEEGSSDSSNSVSGLQPRHGWRRANASASGMLPNTRASRKWWWLIFIYLFDVKVVSAWYLVQKVHGQADSLLDFRRQLALSMLKTYGTPSTQGRRPSLLPDALATMASVTGSWKVLWNADASSALRRRCVDARNVTLVCMLTVSSSTM